MKNMKLGQVVKRARCYGCGKRRECRIDRQGRYSIVTSDQDSEKLVSVCIMECSTFKFES